MKSHQLSPQDLEKLIKIAENNDPIEEKGINGDEAKKKAAQIRLVNHYLQHYSVKFNLEARKYLNMLFSTLEEFEKVKANDFIKGAALLIDLIKNWQIHFPENWHSLFRLIFKADPSSGKFQERNTYLAIHHLFTSDAPGNLYYYIGLALKYYFGLKNFPVNKMAALSKFKQLMHAEFFPRDEIQCWIARCMMDCQSLNGAKVEESLIAKCLINVGKEQKVEDLGRLQAISLLMELQNSARNDAVIANVLGKLLFAESCYCNNAQKANQLLHSAHEQLKFAAEQDPIFWPDYAENCYNMSMQPEASQDHLQNAALFGNVRATVDLVTKLKDDKPLINNPNSETLLSYACLLREQRNHKSYEYASEALVLQVKEIGVYCKKPAKGLVVFIKQSSSLPEKKAEEKNDNKVTIMRKLAMMRFIKKHDNKALFWAFSAYAYDRFINQVQGKTLTDYFMILQRLEKFPHLKNNSIYQKLLKLLPKFELCIALLEKSNKPLRCLKDIWLISQGEIQLIGKGRIQKALEDENLTIQNPQRSSSFNILYSMGGAMAVGGAVMVAAAAEAAREQQRAPVASQQQRAPVALQPQINGHVEQEMQVISERFESRHASSPSM